MYAEAILRTVLAEIEAPRVVIAGPALAWHGIEDPTQECKFPQRKFFAPRRDSEIFVAKCQFQK